MGVESNDKGTQFHFNLIFYFPDLSELTENYTFITENFNYFKSKAVFTSDTEASLYGTLLSDALRVCLTEYQDGETASDMLTAAMNRGPCPKEFKEEIEEFYQTHKDEMDGELQVAEENEPKVKKEELN